MKARVKATGEIVEVSMECNNSTDFRKATFRTKDGMSYRYDDVELIFPKDDDYWTRLEHQYVGMAMQGILACEEWKISPREGVSFAGEVALQAQEIAHALVEKLKEERK